MEKTVSDTRNNVAELDQIAPRRHVSAVDMVLTIDMPLRLSSNPLAAGQEITELGVAMFLL